MSVNVSFSVHLERLTSLFSGDEEDVAQGEELIQALVGPDPLDQAVVYAHIGQLFRVSRLLKSRGVQVCHQQVRVMACELARIALDVVEHEFEPAQGSLRRDPRCDVVIDGVQLVALGKCPTDHLKPLEAVLIAADEDGWWETEAVAALFWPDALDALDGASFWLWMLVKQTTRPHAEAAPPPIRDRLLTWAFADRQRHG